MNNFTFKRKLLSMVINSMPLMLVIQLVLNTGLSLK